MLGNRSIRPVLPVRNLARAKDFYEHALGLRQAEGESSTQDAMVLEARAGSRVEIQRFERPTPALTTAITFEVDDIGAEVSELEGCGVTFEDYRLPGRSTNEDHIAQTNDLLCAWFKDPDGNILRIHQRVYEM